MHNRRSNDGSADSKFGQPLPKTLKRRAFVRAALIFALWNCFSSSELTAQEVSTKPRFIGVWLLFDGRSCSKVLEINMVSDTHANLGFGDSPDAVRIELHDISQPPGFGMGLNGFQPDEENVIGVKYVLTDRDKPLAFYNSFKLLADNEIEVKQLG